MKMIDDNLAERTIAGWGDGWRPIETAPKDGTHILWCSDDCGSYCVIYWPIYSECFEDGYWMPLPAPPVTQT